MSEPQQDINTMAAESSQIKGARWGTVSSAGGNKTIHVVVENKVKHPMYEKYVRKHSKLAAHDEQNDANVGDLVEIVPCRRLSKTKAWRMVRVIRRAKLTITR